MSTDRIRELNDAFRRTFTGGKVVLTAGISALSDDVRQVVITCVRTFAAFTSDNDPHEEHDFGSFEVQGHKAFWKIDLYEDPEVKGADSRPATTRVLTIMLAEEW